MDAAEELLVWSGSKVLVLTDATLVRLDTVEPAARWPCSTITRDASAAREPTVQRITVVQVTSGGTSMESLTHPGGSASLMTTSWAVFGPSFTRLIVAVMGAPWAAGSGVIVLVIRTS